MEQNEDCRTICMQQKIVQKTSLLNLQKMANENRECETQIKDIIRKVQTKNLSTARNEYASVIGWAHPLVSINLEHSQKKEHGS